jgi:serine/threonine protein phosphatase PrpC
MDTLSFNNNFAGSAFSNKDVLSAFKQHSKKSTTIQQGMSVKEISEIVSEKLISVVKEQFQATKEHFQKNASK